MRTSFLIFAILFPCLTILAQEKAYQCYGVETNPNTTPYPIVTLDVLQDAKTLNDLIIRYPDSWVRAYRSVTISSQCDGLERSAQSVDDHLSPAQLDILRSSDADCLVKVVVDYIPENDLQCNPPKELDFQLKMVPIHQASFPCGGNFIEQCMANLGKEGHCRPSIDKIDYASIRFTVNEEGEISEVTMLESCKDESTDALIIQAVDNMPNWIPARDASGNPIAQVFDLEIGSRLTTGCRPINN